MRSEGRTEHGILPHAKHYTEGARQPNSEFRQSLYAETHPVRQIRGVVPYVTNLY